jgi:hypothetical protein
MSTSRNALVLAVALCMLGGCNRPATPAPGATDALPVAASSAPAATGAASTAPKPLTQEEMGTVRMASSDSCNIEKIGSVAFGADPVKVTTKATAISGWFLPAVSRHFGAPVQLQLVDQAGDAGWTVPLTMSIQRPDVSPVTGDTQMAGFVQNIDLAGLPPGQYRVMLAFDDDGKAYLCDNNRSIVLE